MIGAVNEGLHQAGSRLASRERKHKSSRRRPHFRGLFLAQIPLILLLASCGSGTATTTPITVTIFPAVASVNVNTQTQLSAIANNSISGLITWQISGATPSTGDATHGSVSANGLFTAPTSVPSGNTVTVTAVSADDTTVTASATVTILPPATVAVAPATGSSSILIPGASNTFVATVTNAPSAGTNAPNTAVTWGVNGFTGGTPSLGLITTGGIYTAPSSPPAGASVAITAVSQGDPPQSGSASQAVSFGMASLKGTYAFTLNGKNASAFVRAGRFVADGLGNLTGGFEDVHNAASAPTGVSFSGSYTVGADGRGTLQFTDGLAPSKFGLVFVSNQKVQIISLDLTGTATGEADLQDNSFLSASTLVGTYVFDIVGSDGGSHPISEVGKFFADGNGGIQNGEMDVNDNGTINSQVAFTGSYTVGTSPSGRGTAQFVTAGGTLTFDLYVVSRGVAKLLESDLTSATAGSAIQQEPGISFSSASLNGGYSFLISGASAANAIATAGSFSTVGNGLLTGGVLEETTQGTAVSAPFTGTYSVDSGGRGTAMFSATNRTYTFIFYVTAQFDTVLQETDSAVVSDGLLAQQQGTPLPASTFPNSFALRCGGAVSGATEQLNARFGLDNSGNATGGFIDASTFPGSPVPNQAATGTLTTAAPAKGSLTLTATGLGRHFAVFAATPTEMYALETDAGRSVSCSLLRQF